MINLTDNIEDNTLEQLDSIESLFREKDQGI